MLLFVLVPCCEGTCLECVGRMTTELAPLILFNGNPTPGQSFLYNLGLRELSGLNSFHVCQIQAQCLVRSDNSGNDPIFKGLFLKYL